MGIEISGDRCQISQSWPIPNHQFPKVEHPETLLALNCTTDGGRADEDFFYFAVRDLLFQLNDSVFRILLFRNILGANLTQSGLGSVDLKNSVRHQFVITSCDTLFSGKHIIPFCFIWQSFLSLVLLLLLTNS